MENELNETRSLFEKMEYSFDQKMEMAAAEQYRLFLLDHEKQLKIDTDFAQLRESYEEELKGLRETITSITDQRD